MGHSYIEMLPWEELKKTHFTKAWSKTPSMELINMFLL